MDNMRSAADPAASPDSHGRLDVSTQQQLDELLSRSSAKDDVRELRISGSVCLTPAEWTTFANLQSLHIACDADKIKSLLAIRSSSLPALQNLDIDVSNSRMGSLRTKLEGPFSCLKSLRISNSILEANELARALKSKALPVLTTLDLQWNRIGGSVCAALFGALESNALPALTTLNLQWNGIGDSGCAALAGALESNALPALTTLHLGRNAIGDSGCAALARGLRGCPALRQLDLSSNSLTTLPDSLGSLPSLTSLNIDDNRISTIQPALYGLILQMESFGASFNPLEDPPIEVVHQGVEVLRNYVREALWAARVMLVGDSGHGKTSLCRSLLRGAPDRSVTPAERTHALEIHNWSTVRKGVTIKLWDFAGHDVYYATHRCFFSRLSIYVLVVKIPIDGAAMGDVIKSSVDWMMSICRAVPARAQIVVVGSFFHEDRVRNFDRLVRNLRDLETSLRDADESRVRAAQGRAEATDIAGVFWVDCHSDDMADSNLPNVTARIVELSKAMVQQQQFPPTYTATLLAHQELLDAGSAGIVQFDKFVDRVAAVANGLAGGGGGGDVSEDMVKEALTFANDVGLLQYYRSVNERIIFIDPLFLVQAFGVLIYDRKAYKNFIKGRVRPEEYGKSSLMSANARV